MSTGVCWQPEINDDDFYELCALDSDLRFERTSRGEIRIHCFLDLDTAFRAGELTAELANWAKADRRGKAFGSTTAFILPTAAILSPIAGWLSNERLAPLSKEHLRKFPPVCPEFILEVISPRDRPESMKEKMLEWLRGGIELGWLIDGDAQTVYVYRAGQAEAEKQTGISNLAGEGPVAGFELDLTDIWAGL